MTEAGALNPNWRGGRTVTRQGYVLIRVGAYERIHDRKGGDPSEWPADLRVRQFPEVQP